MKFHASSAMSNYGHLRFPQTDYQMLFITLFINLALCQHPTTTTQRHIAGTTLAALVTRTQVPLPVHTSPAPAPVHPPPVHPSPAPVRPPPVHPPPPVHQPPPSHAVQSNNLQTASLSDNSTVVDTTTSNSIPSPTVDNLSESALESSEGLPLFKRPQFIILGICIIGLLLIGVGVALYKRKSFRRDIESFKSPSVRQSISIEVMAEEYLSKNLTRNSVYYSESAQESQVREKDESYVNIFESYA